MITVVEKNVLSSDGVHILRGKVYLPEGDAKGLFHVVHGMTEHIGRYDAFMRKIAEEGFICFAYDQLGHGNTAKNESELGYIADKDGWKLLISDVAVFSESVKKEYGENLPYYLLGHSMGSFIVRSAAELSVKPDKLIVLGTGGPNLAAVGGIPMFSAIKLFRGGKSYSDLAEKMAFGTYNNRFSDENDQRSWLTKNEEIRRIFDADKFCNYRFTISALRDLLHLLVFCNRKQWFENLNKSLPVLLLSGKDDPVGDYGKGVLTVYKSLKNAGANVKIKLYENCRHEILNDTCKEEAIDDIVDFICEKEE
ncbi:MAG: alpha/beta hydrolase [Clostridia bacterium]|nr:alpha/beta hydrolase [Clostridia bacterium]